jgi:hypothetical protein
MSKVTVLKTSPMAVLSDYGRLMRSTGYTGVLSKNFKTVIRLNLSWIMLGQHALVCSRPGHLLPCTSHKKKRCAGDR